MGAGLVEVRAPSQSPVGDVAQRHSALCLGLARPGRRAPLVAILLRCTHPPAAVPRSHPAGRDRESTGGGSGNGDSAGVTEASTQRHTRRSVRSQPARSGVLLHSRIHAPVHPPADREYRNHHLDSTRWDDFVPRDDDIVITTAYKAGTTWTQRIVAALCSDPVRVEPERHVTVDRRPLPWADRADARRGRSATAPTVHEEPSRRRRPALLPAGEVPGGRARYPRRVHVAVEPLLVIHRPHLPVASTTPDRPGPEFPRCPATPRELWPRWIAEGWFEWEPDGWPYWSHHHHLSTWWAARDLPNIMFVHYRRPSRRHRSGDAAHRRVPRHRRCRGDVARAARRRRLRCHARRGPRRAATPRR